MTREDWTQLVGAHVPYGYEYFIRGQFDRFEYHLIMNVELDTPSTITSDYYSLYVVRGYYRTNRSHLTLANYIIFSKAQLITLKLNLLNP